MLPLTETLLCTSKIVAIESIQRGDKFLRLVNNYPVVMTVNKLQIVDEKIVINRHYVFENKTPVIIFL